MPKCDFNKVLIEITLQHGCSSVNLLHISRTPFLNCTSGWLLLNYMRNKRFRVCKCKYFFRVGRVTGKQNKQKRIQNLVRHL